MSSPATPRVPSTAPPGADAARWPLDTSTVLVFRGVLDRRVEACLSAVTRRARHARRPLVVDLSAVTRISVDILALLLDAHADPGLSFVPPLPPSFLALTEMTGTSDVFALLPADAAAAAPAPPPR
ncbi:STAS domain-containing protein [Streptacidiphilus sp. PAMC 29251]